MLEPAPLGNMVSHCLNLSQAPSLAWLFKKSEGHGSKFEFWDWATLSQERVDEAVSKEIDCKGHSPAFRELSL